MQPELLSGQEIELYYKDGFILKRDLFTASEKENVILAPLYNIMVIFT